MQFAIDTICASHAGAVSGQFDVTAPLESGGRGGMVEAASATASNTRPPPAAQRSSRCSTAAWAGRRNNAASRLADGSSRLYDFPLRAVVDGIGDERIAQARKQYMAEGRPVGIYPLAADKRWVAMPDFNGGSSAAAYEKLHPRNWPR